MSVTPTPIEMPDGKLDHAASAAAASMMRVLETVCFVSSRLAFGAFFLTTSLYCLLFYIPFTYFSFIHNPLIAWLPAFVRLHSYLYTALLASVIATLVPSLRAKATRRPAIAFIAMHAGIAVYLLSRPALVNLPRNFFAYAWSLLWLFPPILLACLDLALWGEGARTRLQHGWNLATTTFAGLAVSLGFAATSYLQHPHRADSGHPLLFGIAASLISHLTIFTVFGGVLAVLAMAGRRTPWPGRAQFVLGSAFAWLIGAGVIRYIVLPTISFDGLLADIFAATVSLAVVLCGAGLLARIRFVSLPRTNAPAPATFSVAQRVIFGSLLVLVAYRIPLALGPTDWDFVLQKLAVVLVWIAAIGLFHWGGTWVQGRSARAAAAIVFICAGVGLAGFKVSALSDTRAGNGAPGDWIALMDNYAGADISFKTAYDVLSRSVDNEAHDGFYEFLQQNSNIRGNAVAGPPDIELVDNLKPTSGVKPNIFFFVIDSMRRDYVSAYNPSVTFTPKIGEFARDSVVMQNAFSRYAGTALSEPAIWVGAMQLHMQYLEPFPPMNSLQKLLDTDGYQDYISVDPILRMILHPSADIVKLDENIPMWSDLEFSSTLKELEAKIDARRDRRRPIFVYTQPQNVHTWTLERSRKYKTRQEVTVAEMQRIDAAFGEFLQGLRERGIYDNSIIILTSDHGDAYGELGRFGHSDFLFPEVMRIPLIIHLPPAMRRDFVWDTEQVSFSLDITPSLYALLGHRPINKNALYGRPLFAKTREELAAYVRPEYLLASSYAPVYGVLGNSGESLFIVDAVNHRNYFYDLTSDPGGIRNRVTSRIRDSNERIIRREIGLIDSFYHYSPPSR